MGESQFVAEIASSIALMKSCAVDFEPGLSDDELQTIESRYQIQFPSDLRAFLRAAVPRGTAFPDWRSDSPSELIEVLRWPEDGIAFDVEHNSIWLREWGAQPAKSQAAIEMARELVRQAPLLIPVYAHRYLPTEPMAAGNPVFSIYQSDIIVYGSDLRDYLQNEFAPEGHLELPDSSVCRRIRFWSEIVDGEE